MGLPDNLMKIHKNLRYIKYLVCNEFVNLGSTTLNGKTSRCSPDINLYGSAITPGHLNPKLGEVLTTG